MEPMTKKEFKRLHKNGELLLLVAEPLSKETLAERIQKKLDEGVYLSDYARNVTSYGFIDNEEHKVFYDEANGLVYLENEWAIDDNSEAYTRGYRTLFNTTVYLMN